MSHYDCVLPVDFERLCDVVMPAWIEFIAGERTPRDFAEEFAPWQVGVADREDWGEDNWFEPFDLPAPYIGWFRFRPMTEWNADEVRRDVGHLLTFHNRFPVLNSLPWCADDLLALAIKQSCAVELPGQCPFPNLEFYNRLHDPPFVQVAGTKNGFYFLSELYKWTWHKDKYFCSVERNGKVSEQTYNLLERLFFNVRCFPGTWWLMKESLVWKIGDELHHPGFLTPQETQELSTAVSQLDSLFENLEGKEWKFDLFANCVQRAADCGAGLVTIFSGL